MTAQRISAEELKRVLAEDVEALMEGVVAAMNAASDGRIIAETEEPVRDASAAFRQRLYEKAISLLQDKQEAFSPSAEGSAAQGPAVHHASNDQRAYPGS